jgi:hypothetical protein
VGEAGRKRLTTSPNKPTALITYATEFFARKGKEEEDEKMLAGFLAVPVFRLEDTKGEELEYQRLELPALPLLEVAQSWGISVKAISGNYQYYGYFSQDRKEISLATKEESVFFS